MKALHALAASSLLLGAGLAGCSNDPTVLANGTSTTGSNITFIQIAREGKPGIKELYLPYATHQAFDHLTPEADATSGPAINAFVTGAPASRSAAIGTYVTSLLTPDALVANLNSTATRASYLGYETGAGIAADCTGQAPTDFGGRALQDDVVSVMLGLSFGNLGTTANPNAKASPPGGAPAADDGKEQTGTGGTPNLTNQDVSCSSKGYQLGTFPYLAPPV